MQMYNDIPNSGAFSAIVDAINANFRLTKTKLEELEHVGLEGFFGVWDTAEHLSTAYPNPEAGSWAYVGEDMPLAIYTVSNGQWQNSGGEYDGAVDISSKADQSELTALSTAFSDFQAAGYDFGGVIAPSTTPTTSSVSRRAYLAWTPGTYVGSLVLTAGQIGLITTTNGGSTWSLNTYNIVAKSVDSNIVDTEPTLNSRNLIESGGVYQALQYLKDDVDEEIGDIDMQFASGENISDVYIADTFGEDDDALPTVGAVDGAILNTITVSDMNAMNTLPNRPTFRKSDKPARYIVTNTSGADTFKVGVLDVISDATGQVLTQVLTTHYTLTNNGALSTTVDDEHVFQYYRTCGGGTTGDVAAWGSWKRVNSDAWTASIAQIVSDLTNYCQKADYYDKSTIDEMLSPIHSFDIRLVDALPSGHGEPNASTMFILYLVPSTRQQSGRTYKDEYITVKENGQYRWELIGSTDIDMSQYSTTVEMNAAISGAITLALASYYTKTQIDTLLGSYYTKTQTDTLLGGKQNTINDLSDIRSGAAAGATALQPSDLTAMADDVPTEDSDNIVKSGGVYEFKDAIMTEDEHVTPDFCINDENKFSIAAFKDGNILTKNFNSGLAPQEAQNKNNKDLIISDSKGNAVLVIDNGHVITKNFNSSVPDSSYNDWSGKSICFLGDSIIQHGYVINAVAQFLGCKVINKGWSGAMITPTRALQGNSTWFSSGNAAYAFTKRFNSDRSPNNKDNGDHKHWGMPSADIVDLLVIHGGGNDYGHGDGSGKKVNVRYTVDEQTYTMERNRDIIKLGNANEPMSNILVNTYPLPDEPQEPVAGSSFAAALKYTCYRARLFYPHIPIALCTIFSSYTHYESNRAHYHSQGEFSNNTYMDDTSEHTPVEYDPETGKAIEPTPIDVETPTMEVTPRTKNLADMQGATKEDFNQIIRNVAKQFGFYVIEMANYSGCGINDEFANLNFIDGDMVHPSDPYGAWNYGAFMAKEILNKIPYVDKALADREQGGEHTEP